MDDITILIGGEAGDGIRNAAMMVARLFTRYGYRTLVYDDYPSLIRGGHNFSLMRAAREKITANRQELDLIVALDQQTIDKHKNELSDRGMIVYDRSNVKEEAEGTGIPFKDIVKELEGRPIMRNSGALGAVAKVVGMEWQVVEDVCNKFIPKNPRLNIQIAQKAYETAEKAELQVEKLDQEMLPLLSGNEAVALGGVQAGLDAYYAYPMTPSSGILHALAANREKFKMLVVHPENEIGVMLMALGSAYAGARTMVASSGGGFSLMVEGLSLSGQSETPVTIVECQRAAPSTGVPTYTMQADLHFVLSAGQGEFARFVAAPGDVEEAYYYTGLAVNLAWKYQMGSIILSDKQLSEGNFSFDISQYQVEEQDAPIWDGNGSYRRYEETENGVSPLAFPGNEAAVVKATSYEHDPYGVTTEVADEVASMQEKRLRKREALEAEVKSLESVKSYGKDSDTVLVTWGSTKGACVEAAKKVGLKVVQPIILQPFPDLSEYVQGTEKVVTVEANATGQLASLMRANGVSVDHSILKYNARPFFVDELTERLRNEV